MSFWKAFPKDCNAPAFREYKSELIWLLEKLSPTSGVKVQYLYEKLTLAEWLASTVVIPKSCLNISAVLGKGKFKFT